MKKHKPTPSQHLPSISSSFSSSSLRTAKRSPKQAQSPSLPNKKPGPAVIEDDAALKKKAAKALEADPFELYADMRDWANFFPDAYLPRSNMSHVVARCREADLTDAKALKDVSGSGFSIRERKKLESLKGVKRKRKKRRKKKKRKTGMEFTWENENYPQDDSDYIGEEGDVVLHGALHEGINGEYSYTSHNETESNALAAIQMTESIQRIKTPLPHIRKRDAGKLTKSMIVEQERVLGEMRRKQEEINTGMARRLLKALELG
jgi:hypothetical protein